MAWKCPTCQLVNNDGNKSCPSCHTPSITNLVEISQREDLAIQLREQLFNAGTVAITDLFNAVDLDENVPLARKQFRKAELLKERYVHLKEVVFAKRNELIKMENELAASQVNLNELANKLHKEERDILKLENINYDPHEAKPQKPRTASVSKISSPKKQIDKDEVNAAALKYNLPALAIHMTCVARNYIPPDEAAQIIIESRKKASSG
jgi:hypothetical protein